MAKRPKAAGPHIKVEFAELTDDRIEALAELLLRLIDDGLLGRLDPAADVGRVEGPQRLAGRRRAGPRPAYRP